MGCWYAKFKIGEAEFFHRTFVYLHRLYTPPPKIDGLKMRLLNTESLKFREFSPGEIPEYCILSHTWENEEVTYQEMLNPTSRVFKKAGFRKIKAFTDLAMKYSFQWCWIDTCTIDKTSSAELSEAINSMFKWYRNSAICYVHLADVEYSRESGDSVANRASPIKAVEQQFRASRWFTRGWTLQELIAPLVVKFYSSSWVHIEDRWSIADLLSEITSIGSIVLKKGGVEDASVAQRMCWAANRKTTRPEDGAYCLMGIFGINMPILYGEGDNAFMRLQEEIIRLSDDHSIFAWEDRSSSYASYHPMLARSPKLFEHASDITSFEYVRGQHYTTTNKGLLIHLPLSKCAPYRKDEYIATLNCRRRVKSEDGDNEKFDRIGICLKSLTEQPDQFVRLDAQKLYHSPDPFPSNETKQVYGVRNVKIGKQEVSNRIGWLDFEVLGEFDPILLNDVWPPSQWLSDAKTMQIEPAIFEEYAVSRFKILVRPRRNTNNRHLLCLDYDPAAKEEPMPITNMKVDGGTHTAHGSGIIRWELFRVQDSYDISQDLTEEDCVDEPQEVHIAFRSEQEAHTLYCVVQISGHYILP